MNLLDAAKAIYAEAEHILKTRKQWDIPISRNKLLDLKRSIEEAEKTAAQEIDADPPAGQQATRCPECNGTGSVDSGGFEPWGKPIDVACPACAPPAEG